MDRAGPAHGRSDAGERAAALSRSSTFAEFQGRLAIPAGLAVAPYAVARLPLLRCP